MAPVQSCKRGHLFTPENTTVFTDRDGYAHRICRACRKAWKQSRQPARSTPGLIRVGESVASTARRLAWVTRRAAYGPSGTSESGLATLRANGGSPRRTHCRRGHALCTKNVYATGTRRCCKICSSIRNGHRPTWIETAARVRVSVVHVDQFYLAELSRFRRLMFKTRPDRGGGAGVAARRLLRAYKRFRTEYDHKYRALGIPPPRRSAVRKQEVA